MSIWTRTAMVAAPRRHPLSIPFVTPLLRRVWVGAQTWMVPVALVLIWQAACVAGMVPETVLPRPTAVLATAIDMTRTGELPAAMLVSFGRALAGLIVGGGIGFALGLANGLSRLSDRLTDTTLQMLRNVPHLALIPLVIVWFGIGEGAKLFLVALGVFFPVYLNTLHGIRSVDPQLIEMGRSYGMRTPALFRRIILPGALPSVFVGVRFGLGIMWLTLIVAETIAAQSGLGYMAMQAREFMQTDIIVLAIVIYALLGKVADWAATLGEAWAMPWRRVTP
jgi:sulfonate transport system permease protein